MRIHAVGKAAKGGTGNVLSFMSELQLPPKERAADVQRKSSTPANRAWETRKFFSRGSLRRSSQVAGLDYAPRLPKCGGKAKDAGLRSG
jgi:hypothetical protein